MQQLIRTKQAAKCFILLSDNSGTAGGVDPHSYLADTDPAVFLNTDPEPNPDFKTL